MTIAERDEMIKDYDTNVPIEFICAKYSICERTIRRTLNRRKEVAWKIRVPEGKFLQEKRSRDPFSWAFEHDIVTKISDLRRRNCPISLQVIRAIGLERKKDHPYIGNIQCSKGWAQGIAERNNLRYVKLAGSKCTYDEEAVKQIVPTIAKIANTLKLQTYQVFNIDETSFRYKETASKSYVFDDETDLSEDNEHKQCVTLLLGSNADASFRFKPLIIAKSVKPRCFKDIDLLQEKFVYRNTGSGWMRAELMVAYFHDTIVPEIEEFLSNKPCNQRAIVLFDQCPSHPDCLISKSGKIVTAFLPPNTSALCQPMDQHVINNAKVQYKMSLERCMVRMMLNDVDLSMHDARNSIDVLEACRMVTEAWYKVSDQTLVAAWAPLHVDEEYNKNYTGNDFLHISDDYKGEIQDICPELELIMKKRKRGRKATSVTPRKKKTG